MDEACDGHVFRLHPLFFLLLLLVDEAQTVCGCFAIDCYASLASLFCFRFGLGRFGSSNLCALRTSARRCFFVAALVEGAAFFLRFAACLLLLLVCLVLLHRLHCELACRNLLLRHLHLAAEAEVVAMGEEEVLVVVTVPVLLQDGRYLVGGEIVVEAVRMLDVFVVRDATVLRDLLTDGGEEDMGLITVADIRSVHRILEV